MLPAEGEGPSSKKKGKNQTPKGKNKTPIGGEVSLKIPL